MNTPPSPAGRPRHHPLLLLAALAVILFSIVGTAAIMGWLPSSNGSDRDRLSDADRAALAAAVQQPGQPGYAAAYPAQPGMPAQAYAPGAYPSAPGAVAPVPAAPVQPGYGAQAYAPGSAAYGAGGSQGTTGSGGGYAAAPAAPEPVDVPAEPVRTAPKTERKATRVAETDTGERWCASCGNVESVRAVKTRAQGSGVGAAGGAVLGGLLGNQVGGGHGRQLATVAGAVGGAVLGNQVEGNVRATTSYEIRVRLDDGTLRTFHQQSEPRWRTGDRVRIVKGALRAA